MASGCWDAYFETGVQPWDVAAGALLVSEAGGAALPVDRIGRDARPGIVVSNGHVHDQLLKALGIPTR